MHFSLSRVSTLVVGTRRSDHCRKGMDPRWIEMGDNLGSESDQICSTALGTIRHIVLNGALTIESVGLLVMSWRTLPMAFASSVSKQSDSETSLGSNLRFLLRLLQTL